jgi:hypothetical protein
VKNSGERCGLDVLLIGRSLLRSPCSGDAIQRVNGIVVTLHP